jgi:hypothetical protein
VDIFDQQIRLGDEPGPGRHLEDGAIVADADDHAIPIGGRRVPDAAY